MASQFHMADLFEVVAKAIPDRLALVDDKRSVTFAQMNERSSRLAAGLCDSGVQRGDHVGLYLMNGPEYLESFFAVIKIGAVPFNVNYRYGFEELHYLFGNADTKAIIHGAEFSPLVERLKSALPHIAMSIAVEDGQGVTAQNSLAYETLMQSAPSETKYERSEDDYILQYTGGTTGLPKGVMWPHKAFFFACLGGGGIYLQLPPITAPGQLIDIVKNAPPIRNLPLAPLMHGAAIWTALSGILGGITMVLDPMRGGFDAVGIWDRVERENVNILQIVGDAMAVPLLEALRNNPGRWDFSKLFHLGSGGAVFSNHIKHALREILPHVIMGDGMGTSETGISGMGEPPKDGGFMRLPAGDHQQVIVDSRIGAVGELGYLARTGYTPIGYYNDPKKTAEVFQTIGGKLWAVSGDQARLDDDAMITVLGRGSTCINSGGEKIYPEEVEEVLRAHPAIHDAAVIGIPSEKWGQQVSAVISLTKGASEPTFENVKQFCAETLANYKVPKTVTTVPEIMRSPAGKQDYKWAKSILSGNT